MVFLPGHLHVASGAGYRALHCNRLSGLKVSLFHYHEEMRQSPHWHDYSQISFLLAGRLAESVEGRPFELSRPAIGYKPRGCRHGDHWGENGGLIFSLKLDAARGRDFEERLTPNWSHLALSPQLTRLMRLCLFTGDDGLRQEAVDDVLALLEAPDGRVFSDPPLWLEKVRQDIEEAPHEIRIAKAAEDAGVHRAYLSKMFSRHYGSPPSVYRRRALVTRALRPLTGSREPLGAVAADLGFSDQAHMTRCVSGQTGLTPALLRRLFNSR